MVGPTLDRSDARTIGQIAVPHDVVHSGLMTDVSLILDEIVSSPLSKRVNPDPSTRPSRKLEHLLPDTALVSSLPLTLMARSRNLHHWDELLDHVRNLPYGRPTKKADFGAVLRESRGTCSSKHALLAKLAYENDLEEVTLNLLLFKMNGVNTPEVAPILRAAGLDYIPEAHCFLRVSGTAIDVTSPTSDIALLFKDVIDEFVVEPKYIVKQKEIDHRDYIRNWAMDEGMSQNADELWSVREECISKMSAA